jgi:cell division protein FtsQ
VSPSGHSSAGAPPRQRRLLTDRRLLERRRAIIAARVRRRRRQVLVGAVVVVGSVALYLVARSPLFGLSAVRVEGGSAATRAAVLAAAGLRPGEAYLSIHPNQVAARVGALPVVATVRVRRAYPSSLRIIVTERRATASVSSSGAYWLVAADGVVLQRVAARQPGLPFVADVPLPRGVRPGTRLPAGNPLANALAVIGGMDPALRRQVTGVTAGSIDGLQFRLGGGAVVLYGVAEQQAAKDAAVLLIQRRLRQEGKEVVRVDVRVPSTPTVVSKTAQGNVRR